MALIATQQMAVTGTAPTYSAVSASDTGDVSNGRTFLHVKNGGGSSDTVTLITPGTGPGGTAIADLAVTVANGADRFIGPINPDPQDGFGPVVTVTHSFTTSVTCAFITI